MKIGMFVSILILAGMFAFENTALGNEPLATSIAKASPLPVGTAPAKSDTVPGAKTRASAIPSPGNSALGTNDRDRSPEPQPSVGSGKDEEQKEDNKVGKKTESDSPFRELLKWVLITVPVLLGIGGVGWGTYVLYRNKQRERLEIGATFSDLKTKQTSLNQKLETLSKVTTDLSQQLAQQKAEITRLKQNAGATAAASSPPPAPVVSAPKEQPRFPVSVTDYLAKVGHGGTPVKFEYKERILVADPSDEGGLMIVQDEGRLYVVPSYGFFQTKSDYTNYFEKYYACARPMAGSVWILQPATVRQVNGGWQVAAMGELEVR